MPVHDAMLTASKAEEILKLLPQGHPLIAECKKVDDMAVASSSLGAQAAVAMFEVLKIAMKDSDPKLAEAAKKIYSGSYNAEVA